MTNALVRYIRHVRRQSKEVKETHAAVIAAAGTLLVVFVYVMSTVYGEEDPATQNAVHVKDMPSPFSLVKDEVWSLIEKLRSGNSYSVENAQK